MQYSGGLPKHSGDFTEAEIQVVSPRLIEKHYANIYLYVNNQASISHSALLPILSTILNAY